MKRTILGELPFKAPKEIEFLLEEAKIYDSSCSPEARVCFIDRDGGYYLKFAPCGTLAREAQMASYFYKKGLGVEVLGYGSETSDWLLTRAAIGEDCTHGCYLDNPERLCDLLAESLRQLHELDASDCPVQNRMETYLATVDQNYRKGQYDATLFTEPFRFASREEAYAVVAEGRDAFQNEVLLHGDYCLPNVILKDWRFSAFIDLGSGGVGDRHVDLFWGAWTLNFNLGTDVYRDRFFDAYGRDKIDMDLIRTVAAAETFG